ncbi:hypothetical protein [Sphingomonas sp. 22R3R2A-7]|uniref:hypothetical protein n=1 Tax=Sphingomonas sp. 22R3R2A-7 TaxID=3050230 RepID=UPI002FE18401
MTNMPTSAADIFVPTMDITSLGKPQPLSLCERPLIERTPEEVNQFFDALRVIMKEHYRPGLKDVAAQMIITECIEFGFDSGRRIVGTAKTLGFKDGHVPMMLEAATGADPTVHLWRRHSDGRYTLLG